MKNIIYLLLFGSAFEGSGTKWFATTALGITDTICGLSDALNTVFPLLHLMKINFMIYISNFILSIVNYIINKNKNIFPNIYIIIKCN